MFNRLSLAAWNALVDTSSHGMKDFLGLLVRAERGGSGGRPLSGLRWRKQSLYEGERERPRSKASGTNREWSRC